MRTMQHLMYRLFSEVGISARGPLMPAAIEASLVAGELRALARPVRDSGFDPPNDDHALDNEVSGTEGLGAATAEHGDGTGMGRCMASSPRTTYFGHHISIQPDEWGFQALVAEPGSGMRLIALGTSAMQALEHAFDIIDVRLNQRENLSRDCEQQCDEERQGTAWR